MKNKFGLLLFWILFSWSAVPAQDTAAREMVLTLGYYMPVNKIPYLKLTAKEKVERKFIPQEDIVAGIYMGEESESRLLGKVKTNGEGESYLYLPASFKSLWDSASTYTFIAVSEANKVFASTRTEAQVTRARMEIDTASTEDGKQVIVKVSGLQQGQWLPAKDAELKISIKRAGGNLPVGEEESYTTDSTGMVTALFKRDSLPGDSTGRLLLVATVEDNETYGNLESHMWVPWGIYIEHESNITKRTLWATRSRTPAWLLFIAYSIVISVWGMLIYLVIQLVKIRKLGKVSGTIYKNQPGN
jgi:hypothetical protein